MYGTMIRKIKWNNYNLLGDLTLDFTKEDGTVYSTIILAGENGTGKTTILETLAAFLNLGPITPFEYIDYTPDGNITYQITPSEVYANVLGWHIRTNLHDGSSQEIKSGRSNNENSIKNDAEDLRHYGFAYSKARSGFNTKQVKSVTTMQIDSEKYEADEQDDFTRVKQLLIDIEQQDDSAWRMESSRGGLSDEKYEAFETQHSKLYRFRKAFNEFFADIKYVGVDNNSSTEKKIIFEKHGQKITLDELSTGEKQIVFRGAHLLRNLRSINGGIVLIDEPELSMHPRWQEKILEYYRGLFTVNSVQTVQMIIATHSEYVIRSALQDRENVLIIVLSDDNGRIVSKKITAPNILTCITAAETNYIAFNIASVDYHIELYACLQAKSGKYNIAECDQYIASQIQFYDATKHEKIDHQCHRHKQYQTLPTYIRNAIDHPDSGKKYTEEELKRSIELLIDLCQNVK